MFLSDEDFMARANRHLYQTPEEVQDKGEPILNPDVQNLHDSLREAVVLFSIIERRDGLTTLLNLRPKHLKNHGGQIGFPGGKVEAQDDGPMSTLHREAMEEIGLPSENIASLGYLDAYITSTGFRVVPIVAKVTPPASFILDANEVEAAFEVPFSFLMNSENHTHDFINSNGKPRFYYEIPYKDGKNDWRIWGVTAGIIRLLYETLYPEFSIQRTYER